MNDSTRTATKTADTARTSPWLAGRKGGLGSVEASGERSFPSYPVRERRRRWGSIGTGWARPRGGRLGSVVECGRSADPDGDPSADLGSLIRDGHRASEELAPRLGGDRHVPDAKGHSTDGRCRPVAPYRARARTAKAHPLAGRSEDSASRRRPPLRARRRARLTCRSRRATTRPRRGRQRGRRTRSAARLSARPRRRAAGRVSRRRPRRS